MTRAEQIAAVLAEHGLFAEDTDGRTYCTCDKFGLRQTFPNRAEWRAHVAAALAAQEGDPLAGLPDVGVGVVVERGTLTDSLRRYVDRLAAQEGERVAAAFKPFLTHCDRDPDGPVQKEWAAKMVRIALADSAGALAKHDAEVLRAAADDYLTGHYYDHFRKWLRDRADRIAGDQP